MRRFSAVVLLALLVLAGCVQPPSAGISLPPDMDESELPPGVEPNGISNASLLLDAHQSSLDETGWKERAVDWEHGSHYDFEGIGVSIDTETITATPDRSTALHRIDRHQDFPDREKRVRWNHWVDGDQRLTELRCPSDETIYHESDSTTYRELLSINRFPVYGVLRAGDYKLTDVNQSRDHTLFTFEADDESARGRTMDWTFVNGTIVVDSDGRIHRLDATIRWPAVKGEEGTDRYQYELLEIGVSELEEPEWAETAEREADSAGCE